jgi:FkbM family methyltransferase
MKKALDLIKRVVPYAVRRRVKRGLIDYFRIPDIQWSLENLRRLGFRPRTVVDIGAYHGEWTLLARPIFPEASFLMLEAQSGQAIELETVKQTCPAKIDYRITLLGPENRESVTFYEYPAPTDSSALSHLRSNYTRKIDRRMQTLDAVLAETGTVKPDLIKIDVQGYEIEVLKGASDCLKSVQAILLEVSLVTLYQQNPLLYDVVNFMEGKDFVAYDVCGLMRRAGDAQLDQLDMIFIPKKSSLLQNKGKQM